MAKVNGLLIYFRARTNECIISNLDFSCLQGATNLFGIIAMTRMALARLALLHSNL